MLLFDSVDGIVITALPSETAAAAKARIEGLVAPVVVVHIPAALEDAEGPLPPDVGTVIT